jgi:hypothetical protein
LAPLKADLESGCINPTEGASMHKVAALATAVTFALSVIAISAQADAKKPGPPKPQPPKCVPANTPGCS